MIGILVLVGAYLLGQVFSKKPELPRSAGEENVYRLVKTRTAKNRIIQTRVPVTGRCEAIRKIQMYSEVTGKYTYTTKIFKEGVRFRRGELMIRLDDREEEANLIARKSRFLNTLTNFLPDIQIDYPESYDKWVEYIQSLDIKKDIPDLPVPADDKEQFFMAAREVYSDFYLIKSQEAKDAHYRIYAPFDGVVSESDIYPGELITTGQKFGTFIGDGDFEVAISISPIDAREIAVGDVVEFGETEMGLKVVGQVIRKGNFIDPKSQTLVVYVQVPSMGLSDGEYLTGFVNGRKIMNAIELPRTFLSPDQSVFVIRNNELQAHEVDVVRINESTVVVKGIPDGTLILDELIPGAFEGMKVKS